MPGPHGVITVNGNMEGSLHTKEHTTALADEVQGGLIEPKTKSAVKPSDTVKRVRSALQNGSPAHPELD